MMIAATPFFTGCGGHVRIYEEARALIRRGHGVQIITRYSGCDIPGVPTFRAPRVPWLKNRLFTHWWHGFYLNQLLYIRALKQARLTRPHLIHAHLHEGAWVGARLKKRLNIPLLFDYHESMTGKMLEYGQIKEGSLPHRCFLKQERRINHGPADCIITRSAPLAQDLVERWDVPPDRVQPLPDGVDSSLFRPHQQSEIRANLRLASDIPLVVYLGALNRSQGIDTLLSAIVQLKSTGSPIRFLIMGSPEQEYRMRAAELGIDRMIIFTGEINYTKAPLYLSAGDCAISPTCLSLEPNSKLLGYMACGLPTVAFDTPANRDMLADAGIYAQYDDAADLASRLTWLMNDSDERSRLGLLARERAEQRHSWDARGKALDDIYRLKLKR